MSVYFVAFFILVILSLSEILLKKEFFFWLAGILLILFAGFRFETGYDFKAYKLFFEQATTVEAVFNKTIDAESGYLLLNLLFNKLGLNYYHFTFFFTFISIVLLMLFLKKTLRYPSLGLIYYFSRFFIVRDMGQIRSSIASIICLYALKYVKEKRFLPFIFIVWIASLFHVVSFAMIAVYIFNLLFSELTVKNVVFISFITVIASVVLATPSLYLWAIPERYAPYFTNASYVNSGGLTNPILWLQLLIFVIASFVIFNRSKENQENISIVMKEYFLASIVLIAFGSLGTVGGRISTVFATTEILVVPMMFSNLFKNKYVGLLAFYIFTFVIFILIFIISGTYHNYVPYMTLFK